MNSQSPVDVRKVSRAKLKESNYYLTEGGETLVYVDKYEPKDKVLVRFWGCNQRFWGCNQRFSHIVSLGIGSWAMMFVIPTPISEQQGKALISLWGYTL